jgi:MoxR-like ATPase
MNRDARVEAFVAAFEALRAEVEKVIVGHREVITHVLTGLFAGGHVLLEGVPGLGKTLLIKTLSEGLELSFSRIQFTPDLMPADIIGTNIIVEDADGRKHFQFQHGPIFAHVLLADEINRATPKTQSALLEGMQEGSVTVGGASRPLPMPFFVLATQNPIEMEGTYPLPEAQLDRFLLKIEVRPPGTADLVEVFQRSTGEEPPAPEPVLDAAEILELRRLVRLVPIATPLTQYVARLIHFSHPEPEGGPPIAMVRKYVRYGASPRGGQAMILAAKIRALFQGRWNVSADDLRAVAAPALRHRLILNFEAEAEGVLSDAIIADLVAQVPEHSREVQELLRST